MKRLTILAVIALVLASCGPRAGKNADNGAQTDSTATETMEQKMIQEPEFDIITSKGTMRVKLYSKTPKHRDNFVKLVKEKYYDGVRFHRVIEDFMIQTGDPYSRDTAKIDLWGQGGPDYTVPAEFVNEYWHKKGALAAAIAVSCGQNTEKKTEEAPETAATEQPAEQPATENEITTNKVTMDIKKTENPEFDIVTTYGTMRVRLYEKTPRHRDNFVKLASEKYYDGIRFHRVIEGFMIQTGDPYSRDTAMINKWGTGGPDYTVPAEFVSDYSHKKGALAAARKGDLANPKKASSGSQFYIVHDPENCAHLDGQYTIFGEVISGLEVIDKIATADTDSYDRPYDDIIITAVNPVIEVEPVAMNVAPADSTLTK